jgi:hypothetical protein
MKAHWYHIFITYNMYRRNIKTKTKCGQQKGKELSNHENFSPSQSHETFPLIFPAVVLLTIKGQCARYHNVCNKVVHRFHLPSTTMSTVFVRPAISGQPLSASWRCGVDSCRHFSTRLLLCHPLSSLSQLQSSQKFDSLASSLRLLGLSY